MTMRDLYVKLLDFTDVMELMAPVQTNEITVFENQNNILLPNSYKELLSFFDGGEIFIPGITIYGITEHKGYKTIREINGSEYRKRFNIPKTHLIFGKLNYGDLLCINLNDPYDVILWSSDTDEEDFSWDSLSKWLEETICDYEECNGGNM